jgi:hypothetical protein
MSGNDIPFNCQSVHGAIITNFSPLPCEPLYFLAAIWKNGGQLTSNPPKKNSCDRADPTQPGPDSDAQGPGPDGLPQLPTGN